MDRRLDKKEGLRLLQASSLLDLGEEADARRMALHKEGLVTFVVDRNINYTNVCINKCSFCAYYRQEGDPEAFVIQEDELMEKIEETMNLGGTQVLLQGGLHPDLDLSFYTGMLRAIKKRFAIHIHGFSPPEICYLSDMSGLSLVDTIRTLKEAGLDSIPGGGAEILADRVREAVSPNKIKSTRWLAVMEAAHGLGMVTTATMMFGSVETAQDIVEHLDALRTLQDKTGGFTAFIPWTFQPGNTELGKGCRPATGVDYLRVLAFSRLYLDNVANIQASWVTQGLKMAQVALRFGANDFGSTMIEENVVRAAGITYKVSKHDIIEAIASAGFTPAKRDTRYRVLKRYDPAKGEECNRNDRREDGRNI